VKLCRFEIASHPGEPRSGFLHGSKVYETDGAEASAVHDWTDLIPLSPIGRPPSIRLFTTLDAPGGFSSPEAPLLPFQYLNPSALIAPSRELERPAFAVRLAMEPCLAAVVASPARDVSPEEAEDLLLGITIANCFVAHEWDGVDRSARARDVAVAFGPFLTTPDELMEVARDPGTSLYELRGVVRVNAQEVGEFDLGDLKHSLAEYASHAAESCALAEGDVLLVGPLWSPERPLSLEPADEVQVFIDRLGTLATRIV